MKNYQVIKGVTLEELQSKMDSLYAEEQGSGSRVQIIPLGFGTDNDGFYQPIIRLTTQPQMGLPTFPIKQ